MNEDTAIGDKLDFFVDIASWLPQYLGCRWEATQDLAAQCKMASKEPNSLRRNFTMATKKKAAKKKKK
ncbi:MAG TPA: hypothetical protein VFP59_17255 [Candidatus Angelobacter sp.]|nr:hypothetical protein [Candidatus Angelobacter sp.]